VFALALAAFGLGSVEARADLRICNTTTSRAGVAIGYQDGNTWVTEGWFNLRPSACEVILKGKLAGL